MNVFTDASTLPFASVNLTTDWPASYPPVALLVGSMANRTHCEAAGELLIVRFTWLSTELPAGTDGVSDDTLVKHVFPEHAAAAPPTYTTAATIRPIPLTSSDAPARRLPFAKTPRIAHRPHPRLHRGATDRPSNHPFPGKSPGRDVNLTLGEGHHALNPTRAQRPHNSASDAARGLLPQ